MDLRKDRLLKDQKFKRQTRFYHIGNAWFFNTREGQHMGPYESEIKAELEFMKFLRVVTKIEVNKARSQTNVA